MTARIALVSGANRGIGREVARQLAARGMHVYVGSRRLPAGEEAAAAIAAQGGSATAVALDVTRADTIAAVAHTLQGDHGRLDVLVNNAAVDYDTDQSAIGADLGRVRRDLDTNLFGAWALTQAMVGLLRASPAGRIVNVSSGAGALTDMGGGIPAYRISKASLNALTRMLAAELRSDGILVNSVCPGWVATDMGGRGGRPVTEGAAGITWAATLADDGPTGGFFRDRRPIDW